MNEFEDLQGKCQEYCEKVGNLGSFFIFLLLSIQYMKFLLSDLGVHTFKSGRKGPALLVYYNVYGNNKD